MDDFLLELLGKANLSQGALYVSILLVVKYAVSLFNKALIDTVKSPLDEANREMRLMRQDINKLENTMSLNAQSMQFIKTRVERIENIVLKPFNNKE